ncbi:hypothetical protein AAFF_G00035370 [Aldrovandia affinis]|uniref:Uncharacterized protein n=1 Tax=Aldrovandia affinis TaxID=143900 RepID=A0AAD7WFE1_9TELE|nr:hypothetical protein AAFF_G00035370 [Aldrovandia affinis]
MNGDERNGACDPPSAGPGREEQTLLCTDDDEGGGSGAHPAVPGGVESGEWAKRQRRSGFHLIKTPHPLLSHRHSSNEGQQHFIRWKKRKNLSPR